MSTLITCMNKVNSFESKVSQPNFSFLHNMADYQYTVEASFKFKYDLFFTKKFIQLIDELTYKANAVNLFKVLFESFADKQKINNCSDKELSSHIFSVSEVCSYVKNFKQLIESEQIKIEVKNINNVFFNDHNQLHQYFLFGFSSYNSKQEDLFFLLNEFFQKKEAYFHVFDKALLIYINKVIGKFLKKNIDFKANESDLEIFLESTTLTTLSYLKIKIKSKKFSQEKKQELINYIEHSLKQESFKAEVLETVLSVYLFLKEVFELKKPLISFDFVVNNNKFKMQFYKNRLQIKNLTAKCAEIIEKIDFLEKLYVSFLKDVHLLVNRNKILSELESQQADLYFFFVHIYYEIENKLKLLIQTVISIITALNERCNNEK